MAKILIAETDETFVTEIKTLLESKGIQVLATDDGFKARSWGDTEQLVGAIVHAKLKSMGGFQVVDSLHASKINAKVPIVLLVDSLNDEVVKRAAQVKISSILAKPVPAEEVVRRLVTPAAPKPKGASYDVRIINAFVSAVQEVFRHYFQSDPTFGKPAIKSSENQIGFLSSLIGFSGDTAKGSVGMSFDRPILKEFVKRFFPDGNFDASDSSFADLAGELCNQVSGAVKIKLAQLGMNVTIGLPKIVIGAEHRVIHIVKNPVIIMLVQQGNTRCSIEFCMIKNDDPIVEKAPGEEDVKGGDVLLF